MDLKLLLQKSQEFEENEARADVYPMVKTWYQEHVELKEQVRAIATLLFIWNTSYYSRAGKAFKTISTILTGLLSDESFQSRLSKVRYLKISEVDLEKNYEDIVELFKITRKCRGFGPTACSKILHLIQPELFIMWDKAISQFYHDVHRKNGLQHQKGEEICYFEFLKDMQKLSLELLKSNTESVILKDLKDISKYDKTLAKALDEYNYMMITKA